MIKNQSVSRPHVLNGGYSLVQLTKGGALCRAQRLQEICFDGSCQSFLCRVVSPLDEMERDDGQTYEKLSFLFYIEHRN